MSAYCYLTQYFYLISDFKNWVKKLFLAYFYRSFSLPHNIAVRRPILNFKTIFCIYIQFSFILYKIDFLYLHYFWVKIAFEVRRSDFVIVFLKQVLSLYRCSSQLHSRCSVAVQCYPISCTHERLVLVENQFMYSTVCVQIRGITYLFQLSCNLCVKHYNLVSNFGFWSFNLLVSCNWWRNTSLQEDHTTPDESSSQGNI